MGVIYNEKERPFTAYPGQLARYLVSRFKIKPGQTLFDVGCGRGEFLRSFIDCGLAGYGADRSQAAAVLCPTGTLRIADLENERIPFANDFFDVVFSKSVIEHFYYPERLMQEIFRVLKPGGLVITMCPDWGSNIRIYFEDYTHRTPFMSSSLRDIQLVSGFSNVHCELFRQLPVLWSNPWLTPLSALVRVFAPTALKPYSKFIRFSKEIMLLSSAIKPKK